MNLSLEEIKGLEEQSELEVKVLNRIRAALAIEDDPGRQVKYETQVIEKEGNIQRIEQQLQSAYGLSVRGRETVLGGKIRQLGIKNSVSKIHLVNCNREKMKNRFWEAYDEADAERFHYFFISSCATQMPNSFAERMLNEYITEELLEQWESVFFLRVEDEERPKVHNFPQQRNLINSQNAFRSFFDDCFKFGDHTTFENYLQSGLPDLKYDVVALFFKLEVKDWKHDMLPEYFEWLFDLFQKAHPDTPKFLLFFSVNFEDLHTKTPSTAEQQVLDDINAIVDKYAAAVHLSPLLPVSKKDVNIWFRKELGVRNQADIDDVVEVLTKGLRDKEKKRAIQEEIFNMDDLERMQGEVYRVMNE